MLELPAVSTGFPSMLTSNRLGLMPRVMSILLPFEKSSILVQRHLFMRLGRSCFVFLSTLPKRENVIISEIELLHSPLFPNSK